MKMARLYRISLKKPQAPWAQARTPREMSLVQLHRKLNAKFISRRDTYQDIQPVYGQLKMVERRLCAMRVFW